MSFMLSVAKEPFMRSVIMLNVIILNVIMLNVMAPSKIVSKCHANARFEPFILQWVVQCCTGYAIAAGQVT